MSRTARRLGLAVAGIGFAGLAAFATAGPAAADNGPHIGTLSTLASADGCAKCHRIHSAQQEYAQLNFTVSIDDWCETCHAGNGATTDVVDGVSTDMAGVKNASTGLRAGGFTNAALNATGATAGTVGVLAAPESTTSSHTLGAAQTMWGSGQMTGSSFTGSTVELECTSCHDPHGNGNFRILRPIGVATDATNASVVKSLINQVLTIDSTTAITAVQSTALLNGYNTRVKPTAGYVYYQDWTFKVTNATQLANLTPGQVLMFVDSTTATTVLPTITTAEAAKNTGVVKGTGTVIAVGTDTFTVSKMNSKFSLTPITPTFDTLPDLSGQNWVAVPYLPTTILAASVSADTLTVTYTTAQASGMKLHQRISVAGASGFTASKLIVTAIVDSTHFSVSTTASLSGAKPGTSAGPRQGLYLNGIPDDPESITATTTDGTAVGIAGYQRVYTTANYWEADDHYASGTYSKSAASPFINSIAAWCSSCHTRYYSQDSTGRYYASGDAIFEYRHTSGEVTKASNAKNCIQCHVAHGTNAAMTGTNSASYTRPDGTASSSKSALLRVSNRGTCIMCHSSVVGVATAQ